MNSFITLIKTGLTRENTILFKTKSEQEKYFSDKSNKDSITIETAEDLYKGEVVIDYHITSLEAYDYLILSDEYGIRYAFIESLEYLNARNTRIYFEIDTIQTYLIGNTDKIKSMFIEREHMTEANATTEPVEAQEFVTQERDMYPYFYFKNGVFDSNFSGIIPIIITTTKDNKDTDLTQPSAMPYALEFYLTFLDWNYAQRKWNNVIFIANDGQKKYNLLTHNDLVRLSADDRVVDISFLPFSYEYISVNVVNNKKELKLDHLDRIKDYNLVNKVGNTSFGEDSNARNLIKLKNANNYPVSLLPRSKYEFDDKYDPKAYLSPQYTDLKFIFGNLEKEFELNNFKDVNDLKMESMIGYGPYISYNFYPGNYRIRYKTNMESPYSVPLITNDYLNYIRNDKFSRNTAMLGNVASAITSTAIGVATGGIGLAIGTGNAMNVGLNFAGEIAKKSDLKRKGQTTDTTKANVDLVLLNADYLPRFILMKPTEKELERLSNFFKLYGYVSNRTGKPNFDIDRPSYYIKGNDITFSSGFGRNQANDINERFKEGVRFWKPSEFLHL